MHTTDPQRLIILWRRVQRAQAIIEATNIEAVAILGRLQALAPASGSIDNLLGKAVDAEAMFHRPIVDAAGMAVIWRGSRCPLGYTRLFDLIERLIRTPNRWFPYDQLLKDVWKDQYLGDGAIKAAVTRLKAKLADSGMGELAQMICTSGYRCGYFPGGQPA